MEALIDYIWLPFSSYSFMRRALIALLALSFGCAPIGVFLMLRRMSLVGDSMSHAILPGASLAYLCFGLNIWLMTIGGFIAGLIVALSAGAIARVTGLKEDASFAGNFLISLSIGVLLISLKGNAVDLMHILFGNILAVDTKSLLLVVSVSSITLLILAFIYRMLIIECVDRTFLCTVRGKGALIHLIFVALVVLNLVSAFHALGTLMALGLMILPSVAASFWARTVDKMIIASITVSFLAGFIGLLLSYHASLPSGPAIVLTAGLIYIFSIACGKYNSIRARYFPAKHYNF